MNAFIWCKTQIVCLLLLGYVGIQFIREGNQLNQLTKKIRCNRIFDSFFIVTEVTVFFDGFTACTVNYLDELPRYVNLLGHLGMFVSYEIYVMLLFWYWVSATVGIPKRKWIKAAYLLPGLATVLLTSFFIPELKILQGIYTNYSMGISVYICFGSVFVYCILTIVMILAKHRYISGKKKDGLFTTLLFIIIILLIQIMFPEALVSCIAATMVTISIYLNMENPAVHGLEHYQNEMVMGFATLVENKDDNTGGHIRRSSAYAVLIAKNLRKNRKYRALITKDYINNLEQSAPMHDIGKIGIPDVILQKPGKLTREEFEKMKEHPVIGGKIIQDTFGHLLDGEYENMAYQVALYHHEKWNGKGYPTGISGEEIPLCARIMAVADVFDAVSSKRCYRDAMPLEECFQIIINGRGTDFDSDIVDAFMLSSERIGDIIRESRNAAE
ncbi:MAG: HD-GYP domain-containing protein [Lachnospiraceae bacterium]|nr:HD-GYP domain-containing protein [Lachnospiraceae bacterium]